MRVEIYADILFLINFTMSFFIFYVTNNFIKNKASIKRILSITFLATLFYITIIIFVPFSEKTSVFLMPIIIGTSTYFCFRPKKIEEFFKLVLFIFCVSFCIGGFSIALFYYINTSNHFSNINSLSINTLIMCIAFTYFALKLGTNYYTRWYNRTFVKKQTFYEINLYNNDTITTVNALLDTGNTLREPITNKPVIIAEFTAIKDILTDSLKMVFYENQEDNLDKLLEVGASSNIRLIPFKSVGAENGLLIGVKIDRAEIYTEDAENNISERSSIVHNDAIIAICNFNLSKDEFYNALLNIQFLE